MQLEDMTVFIVDDEPSSVALLQRTLERVGFSRIYATTDPTRFEEFLHRLNPDVILLDMHMPQRSGLEILRFLQGRRENDGYLPVLVLTSDTTAEAKHRALNLGAADFLQKPFDLLEVVLRVRHLLEIRYLHLRLKDENLRLEAAVQARTQELHEAHLDALRRLAYAAEFRDDDTGSHVHRVAENASRLAQRLGLEAGWVEVIRRAAPLHDIGKIAIPDAILRKTSRLTPEEYELMKSHTVVGAAMLEGGKSVYLQMAQRIARSHHEHFDGSGYPDGLKGEAIPLEARVVAVVDVFDALVSQRPFKQAWPVPEAVAEIRRQAGLHFDPEAVGAFLRCVRAGDLLLPDPAKSL
ncbi:HD domain-containing phosphohydrolase [Meiothermus ruber]|nr:HD domain-containing phosphohydrolase [Meiothermus ruber]GAO76403.1 response regulator receiver modulated metaldependent phosphohydrolase [Meiothermus ruber H328]